MTVQFKGGTSGDRYDYKPSVPGSQSLPIQLTETGDRNPSTVVCKGGPKGDHYSNPITATQDDLPTFMPAGGTNGTGTDIEDPDTPYSQASPGDIFKGSKSDG
jgi:hypothetical protein